MRVYRRMAIKESYLGILLFLVISPALLLFTPGAVAYIFVGLLAATYIGLQRNKPMRRCVPCGEIVSLAPSKYLVMLFGKMDCPKCGAHIKNKHRI